MIRKYKWIRDDLSGNRDGRFMLVHDPNTPSAKSLIPLCPPVYEQGTLGSCTAEASIAAIEFDLKQAGHDVMLSRLFAYYNGRATEDSIQSDCGCQLVDVITGLAQYGAPPESDWPYSDTNPGPFSIKPPDAIYQSALKHKVISYQRVDQNLMQMKMCIAAGFPFAFGFVAFESFESDEVAVTGILNLPAPDEECMGGHAVLCVGYDDATQRFTIRNSWGDAWGQKGYFTMPYAYMLDPHLANDFWTIRSVMIP